MSVLDGRAEFGRAFALIAAGASPDVFSPQPLLGYAARGVLRPLDDLLGSGAIDRANYLAEQWDQLSWKGVTWAVPAFDHGPDAVVLWNRGLVRQQTVWDASRPPTSWDELIGLGKALTLKDSDQSIHTLAFDPFGGAAGALDTVRDATGVEWLDPNSGQVTLSHPAYVRFAQGVLDYLDAISSHELKIFRQKYPFDPTSRLSGIQAGREVAMLTDYGAARRLQRSVRRENGSPPDLTFQPLLRADGPGHLCRVSGRAVAMPVNAPHGTDGWPLIETLASDQANRIALDKLDSFVFTKSFLKAVNWSQYPEIAPIVQAFHGADRVVGRTTHVAAGVAETKWFQAIMSAIIDDVPTDRALRDAEAAVRAQVGKVGR